jgi:hypothetical protein
VAVWSDLLDTTPGSASGSTDSALVIGRTYSDWTASPPIHITPTRKTGAVPESLEVVVNLGAFPTNNPVTLTVAPVGPVVVAVGTPVAFTATAVDADFDTLAYYWDFGDNTFGTNSASASKSWSVAGEYIVRCTVSDMLGSQASRSVIITVGAPATFRIGGTVTELGVPMRDVRVSDGTRSAWTDSDGTYTLVGVPAGVYTISAYEPNYTLTLVTPGTVPVGPDKTGVDFGAVFVPAPGVPAPGGGGGTPGHLTTSGSGGGFLGGGCFLSASRTCYSPALFGIVLTCLIVASLRRRRA